MIQIHGMSLELLDLEKFRLANFQVWKNPLIGQKPNTLSIYRKSLVNLENMEITQGKLEVLNLNSLY